MERVFVIVCALLVCARAGPISVSDKSNTCSRACTDRGKFNYITGKTYVYQYESDIKTAIQGASEDHATLHMSAAVELEILSKCEISMRLNDVKLTEYDPADATMKEVSSEFKAGLEKFPVRMSYQDGGIDDICLSGPEPVWVMNAKRGIISLIQNNMHNFETNRTVAETDVSGMCDTEYFVRETGSYKTSIGKSKNLLGCTDRQGYNTAIQGVPYTAQSNIQSLPLLRSDHNCVHEIDKQQGYLKSVQCKEQHVFRPFSKSDSGAVTINTQSLTFVRMTTGTKSPEPIKARVSLKFEHVHNVETEGQNRKNIIRKLTEICERTKSGVRPETPRLFTDLVYLMKSADVDTLSVIYKMLTEETICPDNLFRTRKYFLDALPMAGTTASVHMITELITSKVITGVEAEMWLTTLSFIKNPTKDMLLEAKPLINAPDSSEKALLSLGTMVHSYCYHHGNCETDDVVEAIISALTNKMAKGCKVKDSNMKTTLMALRGLGNAGYATGAISTLSVCMQLKSNPTEVRLSAVEAFRRMPCDSDRVALLSILQDTEEDSEIRIAAYRVLMECPSEKVLRVIRNTLAREQVNQVGSYIWTHLTNLMETSDRHKQDIRALLEDETFKKEFDMDKRKFSRNYEGSMFIERLNTGAKLEGDLIWSSKSFIPRSAMMNLTFDLFGHSVNLFEFGGRAEGLEYFFESFFGPNGYFRNPEEESKTKDVVPKNIREDKMKKIDKRFSAPMADLRGSLYMRVFGNELRYMNFQGMDSLLSGPDFNILDMIIKLSEDNDYNYTHSAMFLDSSYIVPTSSGFPLNLTVNGTATVDLRIKGKMDLRHPPTLDINGLIKPSAAIDVSSMMSVDAFVTKSGIKMVSTLHTSTSLQGKLSIDDKGSITTEYEMPEPRMEIIDVRSSFFTIHRDMEREQKMITDNRQTMAYCSSEKIVTVTGLELCAEMEYPNASIKNDAPYFPITGPVTAGIYLYNRDTHVKYRMEAKSIHNKDKNIVHFTFDTPNSRIDRHVEVDFSLDKRDFTLDATLISPWKKVNFEGAITNTKAVAGVSGRMNIDGKAPYSVNAQVEHEVTKTTYLFKPSFEIQANKQMHATVKGILSLKNWKQLDIQIDADGITKEPVSAKLFVNNKDRLIGIQGSLDVAKNKQYSFDVNLATTTYKKKAMYKPLASIRTPTKELLAFGGDVTHVYGKMIDVNLVLDKISEKKISLKGNVKTAEKRRRAIYSTKMDFISGPADFSLRAKFDKRSIGIFATDIDFTYVIRRIARNNIKLVSKITNQSTKSFTKAKANVNIAVKRNPELNLKLLSEISHNKKITEFDGDLWYGPDFSNDAKHAEMRFKMNRKLTSLMEASADIQTRVRVPELNFALMMAGAHSHDERNLNSNFTFKLGKGQPFETSLQVHDKTGKLMKFDAEYKLSFPGYNLGIDHNLEQTADNKYISTLKTQIRKGQQSVIITTITPTDGRVAINSDINIYGQKTTKLQGEFGLDPADFVTSLSFDTGSNKYAASLSSATEIGKSSSLLLDMKHPARHMFISLKGKTTDGIFSGDAELQFNTSQKISVNAWFEEPRSDNLNGSITVSYPSRTVILNAHFNKGSKYSSYVDFQWEPKEKVTAAAVLEITDDIIFGSAKVSTPFTSLPKFDIEAKLSQDKEQYNSEASVSLGNSYAVHLNSEIKKPISLKTFVGSLSARLSHTSLMGIKNIDLQVNHKLSTSLTSEARLGWNKQFVQTSIILQNTTKGEKIGIKGSVDLKTSYKYVKRGNLVFSHDINGRKFITDISVNRNRKYYKLVSQMTHHLSENRYDNTGSVMLSSSTDSLETTWNHMHTAVNSITSLTSVWGKNKKITGKFITNFGDSFETTFELQTPFAVASDTRFQAAYTKRNHFLDSKFDLDVNGNTLGSAKAGYTLNDVKSSVWCAIVVPDLNLNSKVDAEASLTEASTLSASANIVITPRITMSMEGSSKVLKSGSLAHTILLWKSSFPGYEQVRYTYEVLTDDQISTITKLEYGDGKEIKLETKFGFEPLDKHASALFTTPFESFPNMQCGISLLGNLDSFVGNVVLEIKPYLEKTSANLTWDTTSGLTSSLRIDLPIADYQYFQADVFGKFKNSSSELNLNIEYKPKEIIQLEMKHEFDDSDLMLLAKANSPFGTLSVQHTGKPRDFSCRLALEDSDMKKYGLDIGFTNFVNTVGTVTISTPGRRDITASVSHTGNVSNFKTHMEVQHNRKNALTSDLSFKADDKVMLSLDGSLRTQLISNTEEYKAAFNIDGILRKFNTHAEFSGTNSEKSLLEVNLDFTSSPKGNLAIESPLMRNIKASFDHFQAEDSMQSGVEVIYGEKKIIGLQASLNRRDSVFGELKLNTLWLEDIALMTRLDGNIKSFISRSEGSYGDKKADFEVSSKVDFKVSQQKISIHVTGVQDITAEFSHSGDFSDMKSFCELNIGQDRHRIDLFFKHNENTEGYFTLESSLTVPITLNFQHVGPLTAFKSHAELILDSEMSSVDVSFRMPSSADFAMNVEFRCPFFKDVNINLNQTTRPKIKTNGRLFIEGLGDFEIRFGSSIRPLAISLVVSTPFENVRHIEGSIDIQELNSAGRVFHLSYKLNEKQSEIDGFYNTTDKYSGQLSVHSHLIPDSSFRFEHEGKLDNFRSSMQYTFGSKKSDMGLTFYRGVSKYEGLVTVTSHIVPDFSVGFKHNGHLNKFITHGEYSLGHEKREVDVSLNVENDIDISITYKCPKHGVSNAAFTHKGVLKDFRCHAEVTMNDEKWEGDLSFSSKASIRGELIFKPSYSFEFEPLTLNFEYSGVPNNFRIQSEIFYGEDKTTSEFAVTLSDQLASTSLKITSPYFKVISAHLRIEGEPTNAKLHTDLEFGLNRFETDFRFNLTKSSLASVFSLKSTLWEDIAAEFNINGKISDFSSKSSLVIGKHENTCSLSFKMADQTIITMIDIESSYFDDISLKLRHSGDVAKFSTEFDSIINGETNKALIDLNLKDSISGKFSVEQPKFLVEGSLKEGVIKASLTKGLHEYSADFFYSVKDTIVLESKITTPFEDFRILHAIYEHSGSFRNFRCNGKLAFEQRESILNITLDTSNVSDVNGRFEISSPYTAPFGTKISSNFVKGKQVYDAEININNKKTYGLHLLALKDENEGIKHINLELFTNGIKHNVFDLELSSVGFRVSSDVVYEGKHSLEVSFTKSPDMKLETTVSLSLLPFFRSLGENNTEYKHSDLKWNGHILFSLKTDDQVSGIFSVDLPLKILNKINGEFTLISRDSAFDFDTKLATGEDKLIDLTLNIDKMNKHFINLGLNSNMPHPLSVKLMYSNTQPTLQLNVEVTHNMMDIFKSKLTVKAEPLAVDGFATLTTDNFQNSVSVQFDSHEKVFKSDAAVTISGEKWSLLVDIDATNNAAALFKVEIPDMEEIRGTISHTQRTYRSKTNIELIFNSTHRIDYDIELKWRNGLECSMSLQTPFKGFETTKIRTEHEGSYPNIKSSVEINLSDKVYTASAKISEKDILEADFTITTPIERFENLALSFYHGGNLQNFRTGGKILYLTGEEIELDIEHRWIGMSQMSKARVMSPFTNEISMSTNHSGTIEDFSSSLEIAFGSDLMYSSRTSMKTGPKFITLTNLISVIISGEMFNQRFELKHDGGLEKFRNEVLFQSLSYVYRVDTSFQLEPAIEGSLEIVTPLENFRNVKAAFTHRGSANDFLSTGELQFAPEKIVSGKLELTNNGWRKMFTNVEVQTPFKDMEITKLSYRHSGDSDSFKCDIDSAFARKVFTGTVEASRNPFNINVVMNTPFSEPFRTVSFSGYFKSNNKNQVSSQILATWNPRSKVFIETSISTSRPFSGEISISTPFDQFKEASLEISERKLAKGNLANIKITHNSKNIIDLDIDYSVQKSIHALISVRAPKPMRYKFEGEFSLKCVEIDLNANWNTDDNDSNLRLEAGYDIRGKKTIDFKLTQALLPGQMISFDGMLDGKQSKADLVWGTEKVGYEISIGDYDGKVKLILPSRSVMFAGSHRGTVSEGAFLWDADVDETKKLGIKSVTVVAEGVVKADITITMPSLGKNVKLGSEILVNHGQVIFEGKTVLSYSGDSRKNLIFTSKLEDISIRGSKNYSFSFGVSHPYTTVGVTVNSHAGKSSNGYSAGVGLEYLTVKKQNKKFQIGARIDKLRKSVSFELQSPIKFVSISGSAQTDDKFRVSLLNVYDNKQPLHTHLTFDPSARSIDFVTNFDLENPRNEFRMNSKYVNSSAVQTEVYHIVSGNRITDFLITARLNNSHLLHSRLHWRPNIIQDLEAFLERKASDYNRRLHAAAARYEPEVVQEVVEKFHKVWAAVGEEIGDENLAVFETSIVPLFDLGLQTAVAITQPILRQINEKLARSRNNMETSMESNAVNFKGLTVAKTEVGFREFSFDTDALVYLRNMMSDNVNFVSENIKLPAQHIPGYITGIMSVVTERMPVSVSSQIKSFRVHETLETMIREELLKLQRELEEKLRSLERIMTGHIKSPFTVYDPANGEIQLELYSIIPLKSLDKLPVITFAEHVEKIRALKKLTNFIPKITLPDLNGELLPPFTGTASVLRGHKITTFDGFEYDLNNDCTYILTRDYKDGNFSLILSNDGYTTLTVLTTGRPISINIQDEILVGGELATLPFTEGYVSVSKDEGGIIKIKGGNHFSVDYDTTVDHITVQVSGWYHGKTGGLFGVYDNEISNDQMTSFNKVVDNSDRFAKTWDVGTNACR